MFEALARVAVRHGWLIVSLWIAGFALAIPFLLRAEEPLKVGGFSSPQIESARTAAIVQNNLRSSASSIVVLFQAEDLPAIDRLYDAEIRYALQPLQALPYVDSIIYPGDDPQLIADDGTTSYAIVGLDLPAEEAQRQVAEMRDAIRIPPDLSVSIAGAPAFYADIETMSQRDLRRAEMIALPIALVALIVVFRSLVAASVTLVAGGLSVAGILVTLFAIAHVTDLSIFVLNLATMLGLGLAVDYSLFITSRFREELRRSGGQVDVAVIATAVTAGRAVFFSGFTVLIGLSGLMLFDFMFLRSVGIAGVVVVVFAVAAALTLLPAMLGIVGTRIDSLQLPFRGGSRISSEPGQFWIRLSTWVMRRPLLVLIPATVFLLTLGFPFRHVVISSPDATILPPGLPSRQAFDVMVDSFGPGEISPFVIAFQTDGDMYSAENLGALVDLTRTLEADPRISHIRGVVPTDPEANRDQAVALLQLQPRLMEFGLANQSDRFLSDRAALILAYGEGYAIEDQNKDLLSDIRQWTPTGDVQVSVGGATAEIVDVVDKMYGQAPAALLWIIGATYLVLLVLFRSVILPLKAIVLNTMSILASYGALVFVFQDGRLDHLLGIEAQGYVEASLPIIMFCVLFGLSMDYEVFLLTRIREEWERTGDNTQAVAVGLQRSGRIITSAALIVVVVTLSFASAEVVLIKALGVGIAIAVFLDATIIRALLVPATMRLMGTWNWWIPEWLDRILPSAMHEGEASPPVLSESH